MASGNAFPAEMPDRPSRPIALLDDETVERLLAGRLDPEDAPLAYAEVARLLRAVAGPARPDELAGQAAALAAFRVARPRPARSRPGPGPGPVRRQAAGPPRGRVRLAAATMAGTLFLSGAATAAGGALPVLVERVARAVSHVGDPPPAEPIRVLPPQRPAPPPPPGVTGSREPATPSSGGPATLDRDGGAATPGSRPAHAGRPGKPRPSKVEPGEHGGGGAGEGGQRGGTSAAGRDRPGGGSDDRERSGAGSDDR
jgi:hypothetical protein